MARSLTSSLPRVSRGQCDETEPQWPQCALNDVWNTLAAWTLIKTDLYCENKTHLSSVPFFRHERTSYLQTISPDLSVTVFVTLHYLTLTLTVGAPHLHSKKVANKELRARNAHYPKSSVLYPTISSIYSNS
jgi:hypothetical protein